MVRRFGKRQRATTVSQNDTSPLKQFRDDLRKINEKSQDSFETQLSYIAAGGIGITVAFLSDIIPMKDAKYLGFLLFGWLSLTATLLINLRSHTVSFNNNRRTIAEINAGNYEQENAVRRNRVISIYNNISVGSLIAGIFTILLFIALNFYNMAKQSKPAQPPQPSRPQTTKPAQPGPKPDRQKNGRESEQPPKR